MVLIDRTCFFLKEIESIHFVGRGYSKLGKNDLVNFYVKNLIFIRGSVVYIGFTAKLAEYFQVFLANFGQFTWNNAGSDNSITAFVFKASLADLCNSPLKNGITSTAAKRTKKKT